MQIIGKKSLTFFVRIFTDIMILLNIVTLIFLPPILRLCYDYLLMEYVFTEDFGFMLVFLYIAGSFTLFLLVIGHLFLRTLEKGIPFDPINTKYFRLLSLDFLLLAALFVIKNALYGTILTIVCAGMFLILAVLALILSEVFRQASIVWEEHQLTI